MRTLPVLALLALGHLPAIAAEAVHLGEDAASTVSWHSSIDVKGEGSFEFQPPKDGEKPVTHPVTLSASFRFTERRLPPAGRDEAAFRALRRFEQARSEIRVGTQSSHPVLRPDRATIVLQATRQGVTCYSPDGPLTANEIELLPLPGDPLLLAALLPGRDVAIGDVWTPDAWIAQALAGAEVAVSAKASCRLEAVRDGRATIAFEADVEGATKGATTNTTLKGTLTYDLTADTIVAADLTHTETRSIGPLAPGMTLTLTSRLKRSAAPRGVLINDAALAAIPLDAPSESLWVEHPAPFGVMLAGDRDWRLFHQTGQLLILRLLDQGGLIAQCNVAPAPRVKAGERTPDQQFQSDIRRSLGDQLAEITGAEELQNGTGLSIYRVTATGKVRDTDRVWRYYLVTAKDGRQASFVFTVEPDTLRRLGDRDLELVLSTTFVDSTNPTPATAKP